MKRGPEFWERLVDRFLGPREWSVVVNRRVVGAEVYAVPKVAIFRSDWVPFRNLRQREAEDIAAVLRTNLNPPPQGFNCRCTLKDPTP